MIQTLDLRGTRPTRAELGDLIPRARVDVSVTSWLAFVGPRSVGLADGAF